MVSNTKTTFQKRIGQALAEAGFITSDQLDESSKVAERQGKRLTDVLVELKLVSREVLTTALSFQLKVPIINLKQVQIDPKLLEMIPEDFAQSNQVIPIAIGPNGELQVAMESPHDFELINTLSAMTRKSIRPMLPIDTSIKELIDVIYKDASKVSQEIEQAFQAAPKSTQRAITQRVESTLEGVSEAPVVRAVEMVTLQAVKARASDIHLVPTVDCAKVIYRIDGVLNEVHTLPLGIHESMISRIKIMSNLDITEKRRPQDGSFTLTFGERTVNFRVAVADTAYGEMMVIRVLDKGQVKFDMGELGLTGSPRQAYDRLLNLPLGMIVISGPTGSGKTTTLYASLLSLANGKRNIMTIEDPVEYRFENIHQMDTNPDIGVDFAKGLRSIMRMDPDIILVGEVRDNETAQTAIQAANTGHLVLSSVHANDAPSTITRFADLGVEPFAIASGLAGVVAQRLVRKTCTHCSVPTAPTALEALAYEQELQEPATEFMVGQGCNMCTHTGFMGRMAVFEVLPITEGIISMIVKQSSSHEIREQALKEGLVTLRHDGMLKVKAGLTTISEIMRYVFTTS